MTTKDEKAELEFNKNDDHLRLLLSDLRRNFAQVAKGGGDAKIEKEHSRGKLTARERIAYLLDAEAPSIEIGAFAAHDMYKEHGGCPSA